MALGTALPARLALSAGTVYYADGATGARANGGTSLAVRSSGLDGATAGTNTLTSASAAWTSADIGHGIKIDVGGTPVWRKITAVGSATSLTFNGATIAAGASRSWVVGGAWKEPQDFYDLAGPSAVSPAPGDILEVRQWRTTLTAAITAADTVIPVASTAGFPASGTVFPLQLESTGVHSVGFKGVTVGTNTLTDVDAAWTSADVGRAVWIQDAVGTAWVKRIITAVNSATSITFSGATVSAATARHWRVYTVEVVRVDSYSGLNLTVTRGFASTTAVAHAQNTVADVPYQGKRASSLTDSGGRHVINTSGTVGAPYTVRNYAGHFVYLHPNANLAQGTQNETLVIRNNAAYWRVQGRYQSGALTVERSRTGTGNPTNLYIVNGSTNVELLGIVTRFSQGGSGCLIEDTCSAIHSYGVEDYLNDIDLAFNHHGFYQQGLNGVLANGFIHDHAFGNGIQQRVTAVGGIVTNCVFARNRVGGTGSGVVAENDTVGARVVNNIIIDCSHGVRQLNSAAQPGSDADNRAHHNIANGNINNFTNDVANANSAFKWDVAGTDKSAAGPGDNLTSDPLLVNRKGIVPADTEIQAGSPAVAYGDETYCPTFDFDGNARTQCDAGAFGFAAVVTPPPPTFTGQSYVTLEEMKATLSLTGQTYADDNIEVALEAASRAVDGLAGGRRFYADSDASQVRYYTPDGGYELEIDDLIEATALELDRGGDGTYEESWTLGIEYKLAPVNAPADGKPYTELRVIRGTTNYGCFPDDCYPDSVKVTGRFGWETVPPGVKALTTLIATRTLKLMREAPFGVAGIGAEGIAVRISREIPDAPLMLSGLVRRKLLV